MLSTGGPGFLFRLSGIALWLETPRPTARQGSSSPSPAGLNILVSCRTTDEIVTVRCSQPSACKRPSRQPAAAAPLRSRTRCCSASIACVEIFLIRGERVVWRASCLLFLWFFFCIQRAKNTTCQDDGGPELGRQSSSFPWRVAKTALDDSEPAYDGSTSCLSSWTLSLRP